MGWLQQEDEIMAVHGPGHPVGTGGCSLMLPQTAALVFYEKTILTGCAMPGIHPHHRDIILFSFHMSDYIDLRLYLDL